MKAKELIEWSILEGKFAEGEEYYVLAPFRANLHIHDRHGAYTVKPVKVPKGAMLEYIGPYRHGHSFHFIDIDDVIYYESAKPLKLELV